MISFLVMCRFRQGYLANPKIINLFSVLDKAVEDIPEKYYNQIEFLIKFDSDDQVAIERIKGLKKYPFVIKPIFYGRWEGLQTAHYHFTHLFSKRNPSYKFVGTFADDSIFYKPNIDEMFSILNKSNEYTILSGNPRIPETIDKAKDYRGTPAGWVYWMEYSFPIVSAKIYEICGGLGWQLNTCNFVTLLGVILYAKYNLNIFKSMGAFIMRKNRKLHDTFDINNTFNLDMAAKSDKIKNPYYFDLVEQQAKNIYLNMIADGQV